MRKILLLPNWHGFHKNGRGAKHFSCPPHFLRAGAASGARVSLQIEYRSVTSRRFYF